MSPNLKIKNIVKNHGFYKSYRQPSIMCYMEFSAVNVDVDYSLIINEQLNNTQLGVVEHEFTQSTFSAVDFFIQCFHKAYLAKNIPIFDFPSYDYECIAENKYKIELTLPNLGEHIQAITGFIVNLVNMFNACFKDSLLDDKTLALRIDKSLNILAKSGLSGYNNKHIIKGANELNLPWLVLSQRNVQVGWGEKSAWFNSSIGPSTPAVGVNLAMDKFSTSALLRNCRLPVLMNQIINTFEEAEHFVSVYGFPVVLKPNDGSKGRGVFANIVNNDELHKAFLTLQKVFNNIIIEQHFTGNDHRFTIINHKVEWVVERTPCHIVGDGVHSIQQLIDEKNQEKLLRDNGFGLIKVDADVMATLVKHQLNLKSVLAKDELLYLREIANVSAGGSITPVKEKVHPDNILLAEKAARLCRLDIAGVDIILPDVTQSWLTTGAHICEVNPQPEMSSHLPLLMLKNEQCNLGRIPIQVIVIDSISMVGNEAWNEQLNDYNVICIDLSKSYTEQMQDLLNKFNGAVIDNQTKKILFIMTFDYVMRAECYPFDACSMVLNLSGKNIDSTSISLFTQTIKNFDQNDIDTDLQQKIKNILQNRHSE